jgi:hypothetical protein
VIRGDTQRQIETVMRSVRMEACHRIRASLTPDALARQLALGDTACSFYGAKLSAIAESHCVAPSKMGRLLGMAFEQGLLMRVGQGAGRLWWPIGLAASMALRQQPTQSTDPLTRVDKLPCLTPTAKQRTPKHLALHLKSTSTVNA